MGFKMVKRWGDIVSGMGAFALSLLSCALCPLCLPVYAGVLSLMGLEFTPLHHFLFPATAVFASFSLGFMAYQTYIHKGKWTPFGTAFVAVFCMLIATFYDIDVLLYTSLALFMASLLWNKKSLVHHKGDHCC